MLEVFKVIALLCSTNQVNFSIDAYNLKQRCHQYYASCIGEHISKKNSQILASTINDCIKQKKFGEPVKK